MKKQFCNRVEISAIRGRVWLIVIQIICLVSFSYAQEKINQDSVLQENKSNKWLEKKHFFNLEFNFAINQENSKPNTLNENSGMNLSPSYGIFLNRNLLLALSLKYANQSNIFLREDVRNYEKDTFKRNLFGAGVRLRYLKKIFGEVLLFGEINSAFLIGKSKYSDVYMDFDEDVYGLLFRNFKRFEWNTYGNLGVGYLITNKIALEFSTNLILLNKEDVKSMGFDGRDTLGGNQETGYVAGKRYLIADFVGKTSRFSTIINSFLLSAGISIYL